MQIIAWLIKIVIFIALLGFALGNTEVVHLGVFGKQEVGFDAPLVVFLLGFFAPRRRAPAGKTWPCL